MNYYVDKIRNEGETNVLATGSTILYYTEYLFFHKDHVQVSDLSLNFFYYH